MHGTNMKNILWHLHFIKRFLRNFRAFIICLYARSLLFTLANSLPSSYFPLFG